ncbi:MAG: DUF368 domain-containing protein [Balneolaceae bacterium]
MTEKKQKPKTDVPDRTTWSETPWLALKGFLMGSADIVPGVSGGTMALITGIYDRLINAIRSVDKTVVISLFSLQFRTLFAAFHWRFLLILLSGIVAAIFFFTRIVPLQVYMYTDPEIIYGLFFGLILGSVIALLREVDRSEYGFKTFIPLMLGTLAGYWIVSMVPADTPENFWFVFFSGIIVLSALILPGVSGSYLLLILGKYDYVLRRLGELGNEGTGDALLALLPLFLGGLVGLALFSRILSWLLRHYHTITMMVLIGFLIGSLYVIWPYQEREYRETVTQTDIHLITDPVVQQLKENPPDTLKPEYIRLGSVTDASEAGRETAGIEVEHVSRELVESRLFLPGAEEEPAGDYNFWGGVAGFLTGLVLVIGLDYLRRKK